MQGDNYLLICGVRTFPGPFPQLQIVLNHWTLCTDPSPGFGLLYKEKPSSVWPSLSFPNPTKWYVTKWANNSVPGLCKIPDLILWKVLMNVFSHISYNFVPIKKHVLIGKTLGIYVIQFGSMLCVIFKMFYFAIWAFLPNVHRKVTHHKRLMKIRTDAKW